MAALEQARAIDRHAEQIYQRIMIVQARLGRTDADRRTYRLLETTLEDLSVDPSQDTQELVSRLLDPRRPRPPPPPTTPAPAQDGEGLAVRAAQLLKSCSAVEGGDSVNGLRGFDEVVSDFKVTHPSS